MVDVNVISRKSTLSLILSGYRFTGLARQDSLSFDRQDQSPNKMMEGLNGAVSAMFMQSNIYVIKLKLMEGTPDIGFIELVSNPEACKAELRDVTISMCYGNDLGTLVEGTLIAGKCIANINSMSFSGEDFSTLDAELVMHSTKKNVFSALNGGTGSLRGLGIR